MYKFIRYFIMGWKNYPSMMAWRKAHFTDEQIKEMEKEDARRGIAPVNSRFDYALMSAKVHYNHRDRYGRKCRKYNGDCERCNAKHC